MALTRGVSQSVSRCGAFGTKGTEVAVCPRGAVRRAGLWLWHPAREVIVPAGSPCAGLCRVGHVPPLLGRSRPVRRRRRSTPARGRQHWRHQHPLSFLAGSETWGAGRALGAAPVPAFCRTPVCPRLGAAGQPRSQEPGTLPLARAPGLVSAGPARWPGLRLSKAAVSTRPGRGQHWPRVPPSVVGSHARPTQRLLASANEELPFLGGVLLQVRDVRGARLWDRDAELENSSWTVAGRGDGG